MLLQKNLHTLRKLYPTLAKRISWPVDSNHIIEKDNKIGYVLHDTPYPISLSRKKLQRFAKHAPYSKDVLLWGCGVGDILDVLLAKQNNIVLWERDPWLLRILLKRRDFGPFLRSGQLRILLGSDIVLERGNLQDYQMMGHPFFSSLYKFEKNIVLKPQAPIVFLCKGELFVSDVGNILQHRGYAVYMWDVECLSHDEVVYGALMAKPSLCVSINYRYGLAEIVERTSSKLLVWEIDPSMDRIRNVETDTKSSFIYTWRAAHIDSFRRSGFQNVKYLPLATNTKRCFPTKGTLEERDVYGCSVSFVGASLVDQGQHYRDVFLSSYAQWSGREDGSEKLQGLMREQSKDLSIFIADELLGYWFPDFSKAMEDAQVSLSSLLGEWIACLKRQSYVMALQDHDIQVWGDRGWSGVPNYRGQAGHLREVVHVYRRSIINIDINRIYQPDIVTMRVFDVIATGGFILTEYTPALDDLFDVGVEIATYTTMDDLIEKVDFYRSHPEERTRIIQAGRKRVHAEHTMEHRLTTMLSAIHEK
ncbi:MAG: hypothetical protein CL916_08290 [Deltaproteobacteria bacterium]|nr:hypothetical protein [Deltaproteobacteria bacterium]